MAVRPLGRRFIGELGLGPYLSMNTTTLAGRQRNDSHWGLLLSAAVQLPRVFINFNRVKTLRQTDDRDVFQLGLLKRFN